MDIFECAANQLAEREKVTAGEEREDKQNECAASWP